MRTQGGTRRLEDSFGFNIFRVYREMHADLARRLAGEGLVGAEWALLSRAAEGECTPAELADRLEVDRAAVTRLIEQLLRKKLITTVPNPADRRSTLVRLSPAGRRLLPRLRAMSQAVNRRFLTLLPPDEAEQIEHLAAKLSALAARRPPAQEPPPGDAAR